MRSIHWIFLVLLCIQLIACTPETRAGGADATSSDEIFTTQISTLLTLEIKPTSTPTQFPTPTLIPFSLIGTPQVIGIEKITAENAIQLEEIARWGIGKFFGAVQSPDMRFIALTHTQGVSFRYETDLLPISEIYTPFIVSQVSYAHDLDIAAIASNFGDVWIVDYLSERVLKQYHFPVGYLSAIAISPDGNNVLIGSSEGVFFQPIQGGSPEKSPINSSPAHSLAFSPDGNLIAIGYDEQIEIWDLKKEKVLQVIENDWWVENLAFSPDASLLSAFIRDRLIIWKVSDASIWAIVMAINPDDFDPLYSVDPIFALSPDWNTAITQYSTSVQSSLRLIALPSGSVINEIVLEENQSPKFLAFNNDNSIITILKETEHGERYNLASWNINDKSLNLYKTISYQVTRLTVTQNSDLVAVGLSNGQVRLLSAINGNQIYEFPIKHERAVSGLQFIEQGENLISVGGGKSDIVIVWDIVSREKIYGFDAPEEFIVEDYQSKVTLSPDGKSIILSYFQGDGTLLMDDPVFYDTWNRTDNGEIIASLKIEPSRPSNERAYIFGPPSIEPMAISPDGNSVVAFAFVPGGSIERGYYLWTTNSSNGIKIIGEEVKNGEFLTPNLGEFVNTAKPDLLVFSPDGRWLGATQGTTVRIWEVETWNIVSDFKISDDQEESTSSYSLDKTLSETSTPFQSYYPIFMLDNIQAIQFSNNGELVATAGGNGILRIWRVSNGELLAVIPPMNLQGSENQGQTLQYHPSILSLSFSADNSRIYAGDDIGIIHVFSIAP